MREQRGVAVLMVLLIMALATVLAVWMTTQQSLWLRQMQGQFDHAQAKRFALAGVDWARAVLADDLSSSTTDHEQELWTARLPPIPLDDGEIQGVIEDRQGLFNLNNLVRAGVVDAVGLAQYRRLLRLLDLPDALASTLVDWLDADDVAQLPGGAESAYYLALPEPCRAANRPLQELAELERVKGYDRQVIERLTPFVTALPMTTPLNVNFASAEVLSAVLDIPLAESRQLLQQRRGSPFKSVTEFSQRLAKPNALAVEAVIGVRSDFFRVVGRAIVGKAQVNAETLLQRQGGPWPVVIWQAER